MVRPAMSQMSKLDRDEGGKKILTLALSFGVELLRSKGRRPDTSGTPSDASERAQLMCSEYEKWFGGDGTLRPARSTPPTRLPQPSAGSSASLKPAISSRWVRSCIYSLTFSGGVF